MIRKDSKSFELCASLISPVLHRYQKSTPDATHLNVPYSAQSNELPTVKCALL